MSNLYRGRTFECHTDNSEYFEDGVLTADGPFNGHRLHREEQLQDAFKHQPLVDRHLTQYEQFKLLANLYAKKQIFVE